MQDKMELKQETKSKKGFRLWVQRALGYKNTNIMMSRSGNMFHATSVLICSDCNEVVLHHGRGIHPMWVKLFTGTMRKEYCVF